MKSPKMIDRDGDDENTEAKSVRMVDRKQIRSDREAGKYTTFIENGSNA